MSLSDIKNIVISKVNKNDALGHTHKLSIKSAHTTVLVNAQNTTIEVNSTDDVPHEYVAVKKLIIGGGVAGAGEKGDPGTPGINGTDGLPGRDGVDGLPGKDGTNGLKGDKGYL